MVIKEDYLTLCQAFQSISCSQALLNLDSKKLNDDTFKEFKDTLQQGIKLT
jgi:hypothetical protein